MSLNSNTDVADVGFISSGRTRSFSEPVVDDPRIVHSESTPILRSQWIWRLHRSLSSASLEFSSTYPPTYEDSSLQNGQPGGGRGSGNRRTLGTFEGVFCPVALSMFSTLLYLRGGFVVGQAGILLALCQFVIAYLILGFTVLSLCAISTNGLVEGGGVYYMISRALGPEFGGSIGVLFFFANVFCCALYISGVVEGLLENFGPGGSFVSNSTFYLPYEDGNNWFHYMYASLCLFICLVICLIGGAMFARTSAFVLLIVFFCTLTVWVSFFVKNKVLPVAIPHRNTLVYKFQNSSTVYGNYTGLSSTTFMDNLYPDYVEDYSTLKKMTFATVFSILFSSVTGIMNGSNMSGELKDPSRSIPYGTLGAMTFTFTTYIILSLMIGSSCERFLLQNDYVVLQAVNVWKPFVAIGIFAATLSAALGNLIGGSRVLEKLANDHLFWFILNPAKITTKGGNPYIAVIVTWLFVQLVLLIGSLNAIAPFTSISFLLSYASTNLACLGLDIASAPNFRPTFKYFSWHTCLLGMIGAMIMCFYISALYTTISIVLMLVLIIVLHVRSMPTSWGSISQALIFHQVRKYLLMLDSRKDHVKFWRPQILLMVAHPRQSCELLDYINDVKKGGLYIIGHVKIGSLNDHVRDPIQDDIPKWLSLIDYLKIKAFPEVTMARTVSEGLIHLIRISGIGGMKPNTICLGFYDDTTPTDGLMKTRVRYRRFFGAVENGNSQELENNFGDIRMDTDDRMISAPGEYVSFIRDTLKLMKNVSLCRHFSQLDKRAIFNSKNDQYIDVWPLNFFQPETSNYFDNTCLYLLQLACIQHMVPSWKRCTKLRVFLCVDTQNDNTLEKEEKLDDFLRQLRILARIKIVTWDDILAQYRSTGPHPESLEETMHEFDSLDDGTLDMINKLILSHSNSTVTTFLYLPSPPKDIQLYPEYLRQLTTLSDGLPPTMYVHGLHPVTSTTL